MFTISQRLVYQGSNKDCLNIPATILQMELYKKKCSKYYEYPMRLHLSTSSVSGHSFEVKSPRRWTNPTPWLSGFPRGNLQPITIRSSSQNDNMCHSFTKHSFLKLWGSGWICMNPRHKPVRLTGHLPEVQNLQGVACLKPHRQVNWPNAIHTGKAKQTKTKHWLDQQILYLISPIAIY